MGGRIKLELFLRAANTVTATGIYSGRKKRRSKDSLLSSLFLCSNRHNVQARLTYACQWLVTAYYLDLLIGRRQLTKDRIKMSRFWRSSCISAQFLSCIFRSVSLRFASAIFLQRKEKRVGRQQLHGQVPRLVWLTHSQSAALAL